MPAPASDPPAGQAPAAVLLPATAVPAVHWVDAAVRFGLWLVLVLVYAQQAAVPLTGEPLLGLVVFAILTAGYLLASVAPVASALRRLAEKEPVTMAVAPLLLLLAPYLVYARLGGEVEATQVLTSAILIFLPVAIAIMNTPQARPADVSLGLITVAAPLLLPLTRNQALDGADAVLRLGAFALPLLLLLLTRRAQKQQLNFLFVCAVLALWYSVEFDAFPDFAFAAAPEGLGYFRLAALPLFLYVLAVSNRFGRLGLSLQPTARGLSIAASNLILLAAIAVPIGLVTRFITPGFTAPSTWEAAGRFIAIYAFVALPEEILFRGAILRYLGDSLGLPQTTAVVISALIFGAAHLDNPPNAGWYFVIATVAGIFYARAFLATRNVATSAAVHTAFNWLWSIAFSGGLH